MKVSTGMASGLPTPAAAALSSRAARNKELNRSQRRSRHGRDLIREMEALDDILRTLIETVSSTTNADLSALNLCLLDCSKACEDFQMNIAKSVPTLGSNKRPFKDWIALRHIANDIVSFTQTITVCKSTIAIALTNTILCGSDITAESLKRWRDLIHTTANDLDARLQSIDEDLYPLHTRRRKEADTYSHRLRSRRLDWLSTLDLVEVRLQVSNHINQIQFGSPHSTRSISASTKPDSLSDTLVNNALKECQDNLRSTAESVRRLAELFDGQLKVEENWDDVMWRRRKDDRCLNCGSREHRELICEDPCGKCLRSGHKALECKSPVCCMKCNKKGHMAQDCSVYGGIHPSRRLLSRNINDIRPQGLLEELHQKPSSGDYVDDIQRKDEMLASHTANPVNLETSRQTYARDKRALLYWRANIVDLLKLLELAPDPAARGRLSGKLNIDVGPPGSIQQNIALYRALSKELASNNGRTPTWLSECGICGEPGHCTADCPNKCYICGGIGHWTADCINRCADRDWLSYWAVSILAPTEEVLKSVAGNAVNGMEMMRLLFEHRRQEIDITREVVTAAARNAENGEDMMELLIEIQRDITSNPHKVAKVATDGSDSGKELTILLNSETDAQFLENWITTKAELRGVEVDSYHSASGGLSEAKSSYSKDDSGCRSTSSRATMVESLGSAVRGDDLTAYAARSRDRAELLEDHDLDSLVSEDDDASSQLSNSTTRAEWTGQALISDFLAEDSRFRLLCEKAFAQTDKQRVEYNLQRLFKSFHKNLLTEARSEGEKAVTKLVQRRQGRLRIIRQLVVRIEVEQDISAQDQGVDLGVATNDKLFLERWLTSVSETPIDPPEYNYEALDPRDDSSTESDAYDEYPFTSELRRFLLESKSFGSLLRDTMLWLLPAELRKVLLSISRNDIWISTRQEVSLVNSVKAWLEDNTRARWNWWPLEARKRTLNDDEVRLFWHCTCRERQWMEISIEQHELVEKVLDLMDDIPLSPYWCTTRRTRNPLITWLVGIFWALPANSPAASMSAAASRYTPSDVSAVSSSSPLPGGQYSAAIQTSPNQQTVSTPAQQGHTAATDVSNRIKTYILFGVQGGRRTMAPTQIPVYDNSTDSSIFKELKKCYAARRGRLRLWFSIWRLEYCCVVKFNRLSVMSMVREYRDLPVQQDYLYSPRAGDSDSKNPPLSPHVFKALYHICPVPCTRWIPHDCYSAQAGVFNFVRFPKRAKCFQKDQSSPVWGLEAVFAVSSARVLTYHLVLIAGPFAFFGWWIGTHPWDLQNASVPATVAIGALSLLWMISGILTSSEID